MPEEKIDIKQEIKKLSIVDIEGSCDDDLMPELDEKTLESIYYQMKFARMADEKLLKLQRQGRLGTFALSTGHEAISIGAAFAIERSDWFVPAYRELGGMLHRGWKLENIINYWNGYEEGNIPPEEGNHLPMCVPVGSQLLYAAGIGMSLNIQKIEDRVVVAFFGDGASSEGDAHEAMNFASVFNAPVIFICLNNQYAISVPLEKQMKCETIAQRAIAYGMDGIQVDGDDVLAVYEATRRAVEKAKNKKGPTLIEAVTFRTVAHTSADDPDKYLPEKKVEEWKGKDPLIRFEKLLKNKEILSKDKIESMEEEIKEKIKKAVKKAEEMAKEFDENPGRMFDHVFDKMPPYMKQQKKELEKNLSDKSKSNGDNKSNKSAKEKTEKKTDKEKVAGKN